MSEPVTAGQSLAERPDVRLRPMRSADLDVLMLFEQQMFGPEAWSRQSYLEELADTELRYYIVAEKVDAQTGEGELLGTGGLMTIGETAQILTVGVLPSARRNGVGRLLVRALLAEARRRRAEEVLLEVREDNQAARRLYAGEGFTVLGLRRGYYEQGRVDAVTMRHPIQRSPLRQRDEGPVR
ncbi:MAG TPA: ribosomal protein S18-alanine N-acetyltransferase [Jatrophihabitans sp.]|jgi:ribosomal-protein-alanine N-acetyltransferase|uniref:ribosomal protein S18-alanine N-acetyltransferase n=1 Tax=Jatrophihabitans sp. TaxID=1932789 RepID=UPI002EF09087